MLSSVRGDATNIYKAAATNIPNLSLYKISAIPSLELLSTAMQHLTQTKSQETKLDAPGRGISNARNSTKDAFLGQVLSTLMSVFEHFVWFPVSVVCLEPRGAKISVKTLPLSHSIHNW